MNIARLISLLVVTVIVFSLWVAFALLLINPYLHPYIPGYRFQGIYRLDIRTLLPQVNVPVLVIAGERDPVIPFANAQAMARALPNAQFKPLPGIGHMPFAECPEVYAALMTDWLTRDHQENKQ